MATILVLDDEQHLLEELTKGLVAVGYNVVSIGESESPVETFVTEAAELVFLSLHAKTVLAVCESIRTTGEGAIVPILFIGSGHPSIRSPSEALGAGGDYHFEEPLDLKKIIAKVTTYIGPSDAALADARPVPIDNALTEQSDLASASDDFLAQLNAEDTASRERDQVEQDQRESALREAAEAERRKIEGAEILRRAGEQAEADRLRELEERRRNDAAQETQRITESEERRREVEMA
ncbi:MAG: hypothetical protein H7Z43_13030, partial [Clostridia bacterium]|nr:hypothetical protein [Deltaproteobacteria bacterium]